MESFAAVNLFSLLLISGQIIANYLFIFVKPLQPSSHFLTNVV